MKRNQLEHRRPPLTVSSADSAAPWPRWRDGDNRDICRIQKSDVVCWCCNRRRVVLICRWQSWSHSFLQQTSHTPSAKPFWANNKWGSDCWQCFYLDLFSSQTPCRNEIMKPELVKLPRYYWMSHSTLFYACFNFCMEPLFWKLK